jgi:hypothetical protein
MDQKEINAGVLTYFLVGVLFWVVGYWIAGDMLSSSDVRLVAGGIVGFIGRATIAVGVLVSASRFFRRAA